MAQVSNTWQVATIHVLFSPSTGVVLVSNGIRATLTNARLCCCVVVVLLQLWLCLASHRDRTLQAAVAGATSHRRSRSSTTGLAVTASGGAGMKAKPPTHKQQQLEPAAAVAAMAAAVYLPFPARRGRPAEVARWGLPLLLCVSWSGGR